MNDPFLVNILILYSLITLEGQRCFLLKSFLVFLREYKIGTLARCRLKIWILSHTKITIEELSFFETVFFFFSTVNGEIMHEW